MQSINIIINCKVCTLTIDYTLLLVTAGLPEKAITNIIGDINGVEFGVEQLHVNLSRTENGMSLCGELEFEEVPDEVGKILLNMFVSTVVLVDIKL